MRFLDGHILNKYLPEQLASSSHLEHINYLLVMCRKNLISHSFHLPYSSSFPECIKNLLKSTLILLSLCTVSPLPLKSSVMWGKETTTLLDDL